MSLLGKHCDFALPNKWVWKDLGGVISETSWLRNALLHLEALRSCNFLCSMSFLLILFCFVLFHVELRERIGAENVRCEHNIL